MTLKRVREPGAEPVYKAAARWVDRCLRRDSSLFDEMRRTATAENVDRLYAAFVERPDLGKERFLVKLQGQLADQPADVVQLAGERSSFTCHWSRDTMSGDRKREIVTAVLGFVAGTVRCPRTLPRRWTSGSCAPVRPI